MESNTRTLLTRLGVTVELDHGSLATYSPNTGALLARVNEATPEATHKAIETAHQAFLQWRNIPAPKRGELVRLFGEELRAHKDDLGALVSIEVGKVTSEGLGEVQEMIDICDFAVGLSRQVYGLTIATERAEHRMMETWHPLGVCGIISSYNFPVAVWAWNAALALVCGNSLVWKPSEKAPLTALATHALFDRAIARFVAAGHACPEGLSALVIGGVEPGQIMVEHEKVALVSATGSTRMGRIVAPKLAERFARAILELGGNNAAIIAPSANLDLALRGVAFAAMGTAGQRCTTLRRLFVHKSLYEGFVARLKSAYGSVKVGHPMQDGTLIGPLIDRGAFDQFNEALSEVRALGADITGGDRVMVDQHEDAYYVRPALVEIKSHTGPVLRETFAPILYVMAYDHLDDAIKMNNAVGAGLSSSIFTNDICEAERFMSASGSDCGIANVNIGPSGAEIGGAFGGEKETGGGRESGSDSWKAYMRRATNTINYGKNLPLAQGVVFDV